MESLLALFSIFAAALGFEVSHHAVGVLQQSPVPLFLLIHAISVGETVQPFLMALQAQHALNHSQVVPEKTLLACFSIMFQSTSIVLSLMENLSQQISDAVVELFPVIPHSIFVMQPLGPSLKVVLCFPTQLFSLLQFITQEEVIGHQIEQERLLWIQLIGSCEMIEVALMVFSQMANKSQQYMCVYTARLQLQYPCGTCSCHFVLAQVVVAVPHAHPSLNGQPVVPYENFAEVLQCLIICFLGETTLSKDQLSNGELLVVFLGMPVQGFLQ